METTTFITPVPQEVRILQLEEQVRQLQERAEVIDSILHAQLHINEHVKSAVEGLLKPKPKLILASGDIH